MSTLVRFLAGLLVATAMVGAQTLSSGGGNPPGVKLAIRFKDGTAHFQQGQIIPIEMLYSSTLANTYQLDMRMYDRSGRLDTEQFVVGRIAPAPRSVGYMANGSFHGELLSIHKTNTGFTDAPKDAKKNAKSR